MSAEKKREMIELLESALQQKRATIVGLGMARSTFHRCSGAIATRAKRDSDRKLEPGTVWNQLRRFQGSQS